MWLLSELSDFDNFIQFELNIHIVIIVDLLIM